MFQRRVSRRKLGGGNRRKDLLVLQRQHEHIANSRKDFLNKVAQALMVGYDFIAVEDQQITGMARNHHLSNSILDAGWGYLKQCLIRGAAEAGRQVVRVTPSYTSKTCSACGMVWEDLTLVDCWVDCSCGLSIDRDVNAARNILWIGWTYWDESTAVGLRLSQEAPRIQTQGSATGIPCSSRIESEVWRSGCPADRLLMCLCVGVA